MQKLSVDSASETVVRWSKVIYCPVMVFTFRFVYPRTALRSPWGIGDPSPTVQRILEAPTGR